ncbi:unnamed protein product [Pseudo-nitzschia multistriata]|uniref:HECT-type E3 ubiquitin transferase n=1 Tax=Pseudo-nitzschia multistriata TaxID=183589 RepID=A0A448ZFD4_9STRA|nr:unnamed protein product [Pseudo-nitzschia multistriata]
MFDGDFRSRRREVNLSGNNRRAGGRNKRDLLKNAETLRKQRQERVRRDRSAKLVQRVTRGHLSRLRTISLCASNVLSDCPATMNCTDADASSSDGCIHGNTWNVLRPMAALSMCLSHHTLLTKFDFTRRELLLGFRYYPDSIMAGNSDDKNDNNADFEVDIMGLNNDLRPMEIEGEEGSSSWFSQQRMMTHAIEEFDPKYQCDAEDSNAEMYQLLNTYRESTRIDDRIFLGLTKCMQRWSLFVEGTKKEGNNNDEKATNYKAMLTRWAMEASDRLENPHSSVLLATILLSTNDRVNTSIAGACADGSVRMSDAFNIAPGGEQIEKWFALLADILVKSELKDVTKVSNDTKDLLLQATMKNLRNSQVQRLLYNLLDLTKSPKLMLLINHVLRQPQNEKLKLAVSLLARGDSLVQMQQEETQDQIKDSGNKYDWDNDDDSEDEEEESDQKPSSHKKARGGSTYYKRQEILTLAKLDKVYSERIQQSIKDHCRVFDALTIEVATKIAKAPWKDWGLYVLGSSKEAGLVRNNNDNHCGEVERFVESLGYLLQASSSMRSRARFTPLSPLAFNQSILCSLWNLVREQKGECGFILSIFSDLFSHYLVALSDEDFVLYHCNSSNSNPSTYFENRILAKDIVARYNQELHEVYWTKPVLYSEIHMSSARGRLILSGTKLWNALYERWNRLVSVSFCDESSWWFPHLGSNEGDRAVIPDREVGHDINEEDDDDDSSVDMDEGQNPLSTAEAATDALADSFRDPKMARVLTIIPQALPFDRRVKLFHSLLKANKQKVLQAAQSQRAMAAMRNPFGEEAAAMMWIDGSVREQIKIKRAQLYEDSMEQLNKLGANLKHKVQVTFVNKHGAEEPGIDGGGVFKEFLDDLIKDGFAAKSDADKEGGAPRLFSITPKQQQLTMNFDLTEDKSMLVHYEFLGRVLGKAVYEAILVEPQFCLPFLNQLLGKVNTLEDLKNYDEEYYNNLNKLRHFTEEEIDSLGLTFELTVGGSSPNATPRTVDLVRSGRSIAVSKKNVFQYSQAVANELLNVLGANQTRAFLRGFRDLIKVAWIRLFSARELQKLISGDDSVRGIDVSCLKKATHYLGGYHESQPYIQDFWDILENELSPEQQRKFLRFMTSCSRQPLLGFSSLEPFPAIQQIRLQDTERSKNSRLPTSSTCMNLLKLPNYQDRALLKEKLIAAVESGAGFELT